MSTVSALSLPLVFPEFILAVGAMILVLLGAWRERAPWAVVDAAILVLGAALLSILLTRQPYGTAFYGAFIDDAFARFMKSLSLIGSIVALLLSVDFMKRQNIGGFEFPALIVLATLGMNMLISANDFIALYLGLELMSLSLYVLAAYNRDNARATEAGLKYFVLGSLSSGMLLYGASLLYGFSGGTGFAVVATALKSEQNLGAVFGLVFVLAGLAFKISAAPFHMWTPDVYEGAPTPVTAFFASAPKMAAMAVLARVTMATFPGVATEWHEIIAFIAIASMAIGAFAAIGQTNIKRLMAYSSIGHMGFALVGLAAGTVEGAQGVVVYMSIYLAMTLGVFAAILLMRRDGVYVEKISDLSGLARNNGGMALALAMLLFSLAGIPPLFGFLAKWYVFAAAIHAGLYPLAVIGVLLSVVSSYYYLNIIKMMYFDAPADKFDSPWFAARAVLILAAVFVVAATVFPSPLVDAATAAAKSLF
jgi:NADH-quinone oxidoreductase subunit N